jgi:hypothetical protein
MGGYCGPHYRRLRKYGDPLGGPRLRDGTRKNLVDGSGYVRIYSPGHSEATMRGYAMEHRYVMSNILGRPLRKNENVHHRNGDRADNRPENLELWVKAQPPGQRAVDLVKWAQAIIDTYADEVSKYPHPEPKRKRTRKPR